jgi:hypothetical protein
VGIIKMDIIAQNITDTQKEKYLEEIQGLRERLLSMDVNRRMVLVSSGGTLVPLCGDSSYLIDNFATGLRGAKITESFVKSDFNVIYFHRRGCILPFSQSFTCEYAKDHLSEIQEFSQRICKFSKSIVFLEFETLFEYLFKLLLIYQKNAGTFRKFIHD